MFPKEWVSIFVAVVFAATAHADKNWPEFRGPTGQGLSKAKHLPLHWSSTTNVAWKTEVPGHGWSSPIFHNKRLYLTAAVPDPPTGQQSLRTLCFDAKTGRLLWNIEVFQREISRAHAKNSQASPTPITDGKRLYVHFGHQGTACLDLSGKILWKNEGLAYSPVHGNGGSPVLANNALVFSCDGAEEPFVVALNKLTGKELWKTPRNTAAKRTFSFSTPLVISVNGQPQVISPGSGMVAAYNPKSGEEIWRVRYGEGYSVVPRPVFGHGLIFIGTGYDRPSLLAIRVDGAGDVTETHVAWTLQKGVPHTPSFLLVGEELYFVSDGGIATCVDAKTGSVHWQERLGGNFSASPLFAAGQIYFQNEEGMGVIVRPGKQFEVVARNDLNERTLASYAVTEDAFFIRTEQHLFRIQNRKAR